jgi:hypothetical protein
LQPLCGPSPHLGAGWTPARYFSDESRCLRERNRALTANLIQVHHDATPATVRRLVMMPMMSCLV